VNWDAGSRGWHHVSREGARTEGAGVSCWARWARWTHRVGSSAVSIVGKRKARERARTGRAPSSKPRGPSEAVQLGLDAKILSAECAPTGRTAPFQIRQPLGSLFTLRVAHHGHRRPLNLLQIYSHYSPEDKLLELPADADDVDRLWETEPERPTSSPRPRPHPRPRPATQTRARTRRSSRRSRPRSRP
jgi:hypothetical protein